MVLVQSNKISDSSCDSPAVAAASEEPPVHKSFSCVLCAQRKVKCDRQPGGCANCTKLRVQCVYKPPPPPRRRKKGLREIDMTTKLRVYEDALRQLGVDPEELIKQEANKATRGQEQVTGFGGHINGNLYDENKTSHIASEVGVLVSEEGKSRYLENGLWANLQKDFHESSELLNESSDEKYLTGSSHDSPGTMVTDGASFILGARSVTTNLQSLHPTPGQARKLWGAYLSNINPLVRICHVPTVEELILSTNRNLHAISRDAEALLFAVYCLTVQSLDNEECMKMLGQPKTTAVERFRKGTQHALTNANFPKSESFMLLQAFTVFILSLQDYDARVIWIFSGIAQRIGQRMGLHRDGDVLKLPPFETEMRRRLWWQIMILEGHFQKLVGAGTSGMILRGDVQLPSNINDIDLFPEMKEMPRCSDGATEMIFFLIRCYVGDFLKNSARKHTTFDGLWHRLTTSVVQVAMKERAIEELEATFQMKYLSYCEPSVPWHLMCVYLARSIIFMMRFIARSPDSYSLDMSLTDKDTLFDLALQVSVFQNLVYTTEEMKGFQWYVNMNFQWKAFIYLISELRFRTKGDKVKTAWGEVEKSFVSHPSFDKGLSKRALPIAVHKLILKAWNAYTAASGLPANGEPQFISLIRERQQSVRNNRMNASVSRGGAQKTPSTSWDSDSNNVGADMNQSHGDLEEAFDWSAFNASLAPPSDAPDLMSFEFPEQINWTTLDDLLVDFHDNSESTPDPLLFTTSGA